MKEQLISLETAKLTKEKGYSVGCNISYVQYHSDYIYDEDVNHPESHKSDDVRMYNYFHKNNYEFDGSNEHFTVYEAPTQSLLQKWLREEHNIDIEINLYLKTLRTYKNAILKDEKYYTIGYTYKNYEEALEDSLQYALKLI